MRHLCGILGVSRAACRQREPFARLSPWHKCRERLRTRLTPLTCDHPALAFPLLARFRRRESWVHGHHAPELHCEQLRASSKYRETTLAFGNTTRDPAWRIDLLTYCSARQFMPARELETMIQPSSATPETANGGRRSLIEAAKNPKS